MTAVDRPDNGQDEGRCGGEAPRIVNGPPVFCSLRWGHRGWHEDGATSWSSALASGRAGAGEQQRDECSVNCDRRVCEWCPGHDRHEGVAQWLYDTFGLESAAWAVAGKGSRNYFRARADELLALLGGPQPDGEVRQHRMDADCWCQPVQADNGAWDHQ